MILVLKKQPKPIIEDLDGDYFKILVDESNDISEKEQMAHMSRRWRRNRVIC